MWAGETRGNRSGSSVSPPPTFLCRFTSFVTSVLIFLITLFSSLLRARATKSFFTSRINSQEAKVWPLPWQRMHHSSCFLQPGWLISFWLGLSDIKVIISTTRDKVLDIWNLMYTQCYECCYCSMLSIFLFIVIHCWFNVINCYSMLWIFHSMLSMFDVVLGVVWCCIIRN